MDWQVPGYDELRDLGGGAQGRVVLASERGGGGLRAVKYLARAGDAPERDAAALARVDDPHVARIHGYEAEPGGDGGALIMEMVEGYALDVVLAARVALEPRAALVLFRHLLLGLAAAHAAGVPHRDCKPANVILRPNGTAVLVGFGGRAPLEEGAGRDGTPAYRAPEQWTGALANPATDLYAATCVFFECLTGAPPYQAPTEAELQQLHQSAAPPIERLPKALRPLALRGLAKIPAQRPLDALAFVSDLEKTARRAYGRTWESRGLASLSGLAAAMAGTGAFPIIMGAGRRFLTGRTALVCGVVGLVAIVAGAAFVRSAAEDSREERAPVAAPLKTRQAAMAEVVFVEEEAPGERVRIATVTGLPAGPAGKVNAALRARVDALLRQTRPGLAGGRIRVRSSLGFRSAGLMSVTYAFSARPGPDLETGEEPEEFTTRFAVTVDLATGAEITPSGIFPEAALPELNRRIMKVAEDPRGCFDEEPLTLTAANLEHVLEPAFARKGMRAALRLAESGAADRYPPGCRRTEEFVPYRMLLDLMAPDFRAKLGR